MFAVAIAIVVAVLVYKLRTGDWFKLKQKDEEKVTVDFDLSLLMEDPEPSGPMASIRKKLNVKVRGGEGRKSRDVCVNIPKLCSTLLCNFVTI